ncbi:FecR family protein [Myroides pelagicus]|uniref:FecR family protein n=1 Tax=Myroides pelagicus TaxID=270914 RepID=UPI002DBD9D7B|nr:FecR family protein [Myroides pelagicus]MEC4115237.1 FecR family protein [Myroides pelagicus]
MDNRLKDILLRFSKGKATKEEKDFLNLWAEKLVLNSPSINKEDLSATELRIRTKIAYNKRKLKKRALIKKASFLVTSILVISLSYYYWSVNNTLNNYYAKEDQTILLPDNTIVTLYKGSSITLNENFNKNKRLLTLEGRAFFDVSKDTTRAFIVQSSHLQTTVLGTRFLIDDSSLDYKVKVAHGRVSVLKHLDKKLFVLQANDSIVWKANQEVVNTIDKTNLLFNFKAKPLDKVIYELSEFYHVDIQILDISKSKLVIQADYPKKDLYAILSSICFIHNLQYEIIDNTINIK